jgi:hypothetical protein
MGVDHVELHEALIEALPLEDASADVVISNGVIDLVPDKDAVLDEHGKPNDYSDTPVAAVSVDHPSVVDRYRHGHQMVHGNGAEGQERTENLRKAMVDFRTVFERVVERDATTAAR